MATRCRETVCFSGRVQGVGFRWSTCRVAAGFDVSGYVRNLDDGRVAVVAEGTSEEMDRFVAAIHEAMSGYIRGVDRSRSTATDEFVGFTVRY